MDRLKIAWFRYLLNERHLRYENDLSVYLSLLLGPESRSLAAARSRSSSSCLMSRDFTSSGLF